MLNEGFLPSIELFHAYSIAFEPDTFSFSKQTQTQLKFEARN